MVQVVELLLSKCEALSLTLNTEEEEEEEQ
jgi:hypothetical protein